MPSRTELVTLLLAASRVVGLRVQTPTVSRRDAGSAVRRAADCQMSAPVSGAETKAVHGGCTHSASALVRRVAAESW